MKVTIDTLRLVGDQSNDPGVPDPVAYNAAAKAASRASAAALDLLTSAKTGFLRLVTNRQAASTFGQAACHAPGRDQAGVPAVNCLYAMLQRELDRRRQLEREVSDLRAALAQARTELAGTRVGEQQARYLALHDSLTSLPNRRFFLDRLDQVLMQVQPESPAFAVLCLDLDDFKPVNDGHGHVAGDRVLRIIAARLAGAVRAGDIISRVGGDEFACLALDLHTRVSLGRLARKLAGVVCAPVKVGGFTIVVRPSIGIATYPSDGATAKELLQSADNAMYHAKRHKTDFAFADRHIDVKARRRVGRLAAARIRPEERVEGRHPG